MSSLSQPILLETVRLTIGYPESNASLFEDLNLPIRAGQLICFMGSNGVGKSTLIRTLAGLQKPLSGEVKIAGDGSRHQNIAVVLTDKIAAANMTAYELVTFGRYPYLDWNVRLGEEDKKIIDQSIQQLHIGHLATQKLYQLSDGQLQMVMIARALTQDTPLILLDEPTAHLDLNNRVEIMKLLLNLSRKTNKAILISTHELDLALQTADLVWLAGREKNIITGIPEDLVLNGTFDHIFQFKGFDLKTGSVKHESQEGKKVQLRGEGAVYRWTKNALERNGFEVTAHEQALVITMPENENAGQWIVNSDRSFSSIQSLLEYLSTK